MTASPVKTSPSSAEPAAAIRSALTAIYRAYELASLYPPTHSANTAAAADGASALDAALRVRSPLTIVVTTEKVQSDSIAFDVDAALRPLVTLLDDCDLVALDVIGSLTPEQFGRFVTALREGHREKFRGEQLAERLHQATDGRAWFRPFNFSRLSGRMVGDAPSARHARRNAADPVGDEWNKRLRSLVLSDTFDAESAQRALGDAVQPTGDSEEKGTLQLSHIASVLRETPEHQQPVVAERLRTLLGSLGEKFRSSLFTVEPLRDVNAARDIADASAVLPPDELLHALQVSAQHGARPTNATVMLFNKLLNLFEGDPTRVRKLASIYGDVSGAAQQTDENGGATETLEELLSSRSDESYNPNDYAASLEHMALSKQSECAADIGPMRIWDDPHIHAAEIAVALLADESSRREAGPWEFLLRALDELTAKHRFDLFEDVLRAARNVGGSADEEVRGVIDQLIEGLMDPTRLGNVIARLDDEAIRSADTRGMIAQLGPAGLASILEQVDRFSREARAEFVERFFQDYEALGRGACDRLADRPRRLLQLAERADEFSETVRLEFLRPLLGHPNSDIRHDAFAILDASCTRWPSDALLSGLSDVDGDTQRRSILQLSKQPEEPALRRAAQLLVEDNRARLNDFLFDTARGVLEQLGDRGVDLLAQAYSKLLARPTPARVRRAMLLIPVLNRHGDRSEVQRALKPMRQWKMRALRFVYRLPKGGPTCA